MKRRYETPIAEKVDFCYGDQVVASGTGCDSIWINTGDNGCETGNTWYKPAN